MVRRWPTISHGCEDSFGSTTSCLYIYRERVRSLTNECTSLFIVFVLYLKVPRISYRECWKRTQHDKYLSGRFLGPKSCEWGGDI